MVRRKRRWSVIYEGDVGSAEEWCQIKLHTSCDVPAVVNHLKNNRCRWCTIVLRSRCCGNNNFFERFLNFFSYFFCEMTKIRLPALVYS